MQDIWKGYTRKTCSECNDIDRCGMMKIGCCVRKEVEEHVDTR